MAFTLPRLPMIGLTNEQLQIYWQTVVEAIEEQETLQDQAIADIAAMFDDNILTPTEKPTWIFMHSFLTGEQAGLDSQATSSGITTEKTNYDNAVSALTTHLAALTTPTAWNNMVGNTTITGTTFRSKFTDVLTTKQALINKITDVAQTTANTVKRDDAISASYTSPGTVLSAADVGTDCTITIAAHVRKYSDNTQLSVSGGTITGRAFSTVYYVYYTDTTRADTTPDYLSTTDPNVALPNAAAGRHFVGKITMPADGGGGTSGGYTPPGGFGGSGEIP